MQQAILESDCLNILIIQCIKGNKDILDLGTVKEILKVFINMVLWRKVRKDVIQVACYLCDISLMIDSKDINLMGIFCLAQLSENEKSHKYFFRTVNPSYRLPRPDFSEETNKNYSIFSRINYLVDSYKSEDYG